MNKPHKNWKQFIINEAGLSKIRQDMSDYATAFITAFRGDIHDKSECLYIPPTNKEIKERSKMGRKGVVNRGNNKELSAYLLSQGYGIKNVQGSYIENYGKATAREVGENAFFVADMQDKGRLKKDLLALGEEFDQDSIIFGDKGKSGALFGTNKCPEGYPGYGKKLVQGGAIFGKEGEFMSRVNGRPFVFSESVETQAYGVSRFPTELRGSVKLAKMDWREIIIEE